MTKDADQPVGRGGLPGERGGPPAPAWRAAFDDGDPRLITAALGDIAKSRGQIQGPNPGAMKRRCSCGIATASRDPRAMSAPADGDAGPAAAGPVLRVRGLATHFKLSTHTVRAVEAAYDLEVARGQTVCLVGESGSGKSAAGPVDPPAGSVSRPDRRRRDQTLNGVNLLDLGDKDMEKVRWLRRDDDLSAPARAALDPFFRIGDQLSETTGRANGS